MKQIYKKPTISIIAVEPTNLLNASMGYGGTGGGNNAEVKRYKPIIIDDEEDEEWEETTTAFSGRVFK